MKKVFEGRVHKLGDNINTDYIISSRRKRDTLDMDVLRHYIFEDIDPEISKRLKPGDILVVGENFGCGSAMEVSSLVIKAAGIDVIMAKSFSRTFYRNGINGGLLLIECNTDAVTPSDRLRIEINPAGIKIRNLTRNTIQSAQLLSGILLEIFQSGGLVNYMREYKGFPVGGYVGKSRNSPSV